MTAAQAPAAAPQGEKDKRHGNMPMNMVTTFAFFKLDRQFRLLSQSERDNAKQAVVECFKNAPKSLWLRSYSTFGLREDADLFIWMVSKNVEDIHKRRFYDINYTEWDRRIIILEEVICSYIDLKTFPNKELTEIKLFYSFKKEH
jgi:chlorite dismutase